MPIKVIYRHGSNQLKFTQILYAIFLRMSLNYNNVHNKLLKYTPATKSVASAGQPNRWFVCPLARRYVY